MLPLPVMVQESPAARFQSPVMVFELPETKLNDPVTVFEAPYTTLPQDPAEKTASPMLAGQAAVESTLRMPLLRITLTDSHFAAATAARQRSTEVEAKAAAAQSSGEEESV